MTAASVSLTCPGKPVRGTASPGCKGITLVHLYPRRRTEEPAGAPLRRRTAHPAHGTASTAAPVDGCCPARQGAGPKEDCGVRG